MRGFHAIGNLTGKVEVGYSYPGAGSPRPHAPTQVDGSAYSYDANGNLTNAESRIYAYDVENRLTSATGVSPNRSFLYDGDGALRRMDVDGAQTTRYVTPDYQIDIPTGEATVYYLFGGRVVAWRNNTVLRYLLSDHLSSTRGEANEAGGEAAQRRYLPFGGDRPVTGANDLTRDERYTGQKRIDNGGGIANRELYHYGARWHLPGVGVFTQPDTIVPDYKNPQALNRFGYAYNNPLRYVDPSGHDPSDWFNQDWYDQFVADHGKEPTANDYVYRFVTMAKASGMIDGDIVIPTTEQLEMDLRFEEASDMNAFAQMSGENSLFSFWRFVGLVAPNSKWDVKRQAGFDESYEDFGNLYYGVLGRLMGISSEVLLRGAGLAQTLTTKWQDAGKWVLRLEYDRAASVGWPTDRSPSSYGDSVRDQAMIRLGIAFYDAYLGRYQPSLTVNYSGAW